MTIVELIEGQPYSRPKLKYLKRLVVLELPVNMDDDAQSSLIDQIEACEDFGEWMECGFWRPRWIVKPRIVKDEEKKCYGADYFLRSKGYKLCYVDNGRWRVEKNNGEVCILTQLQITDLANDPTTESKK